MYEYNAKIVRVVDGDTLWVEVDLGFRTETQQELRLARIDAPEMNTDAGKVAKQFLEAQLPPDTLILIQTTKLKAFTSDKHDSWDRYIAEVIKGGININDFMVSSGNAVYKTY